MHAVGLGWAKPAGSKQHAGWFEASCTVVQQRCGCWLAAVDVVREQQGLLVPDWPCVAGWCWVSLAMCVEGAISCFAGVHAVCVVGA